MNAGRSNAEYTADYLESKRYYDMWYRDFAPATYKQERDRTIQMVNTLMERTANLRSVTPEVLLEHPVLLTALRQCTIPPMAFDRLVGFADITRSLAENMEGRHRDPKTKLRCEPRLPPRMKRDTMVSEVRRIVEVAEQMLDYELFPWVRAEADPSEAALERAKAGVTERLASALADPIIRNEQEAKQLEALEAWLKARGYNPVSATVLNSGEEMEPGAYALRTNVWVGAGSVDSEVVSGVDPAVLEDLDEDEDGEEEGSGRRKDPDKVTMDCLVMPHRAQPGDRPIYIEAKSAGDKTNTNKRRKEEADRCRKIRNKYGPDIRYILVLGGYFDARFQYHVAKDHIDWAWEHRLDDLDALGLDRDGGGSRTAQPSPAPPGGGLRRAHARTTDGVEARRREAQLRLDLEKTPEARNAMGQFATPPRLAYDVVRAADALMGHPERVALLEPSAGTGAFFAAARAALGDDRVARGLGFEIDPHYAGPSAELWAGTQFEVRAGDFTKVRPEGAYDLVITNPPYVRHHHLSQREKARLQHEVERVTGVRPSGLSGLYAYFMFLGMEWLHEGGLAVWLVPSEFMSTGYGAELRRHLVADHTLLRVHRFDPEEVQFDDALVSSAAVYVRRGAPPPGHTVMFSYGGSVHSPMWARRVPADELLAAPKWNRFTMPTAPATDGDSGVALGELFAVKRGLATGANDFFIMTADEARERGIPSELLRPILPSPRHLDADVVEADADGLPLLDRRLFLLDCRLSEREVRERHPALWEYILDGEADEIHDRYLCSTRSPWYAQERREPAPFVIPYMGRGSSERVAFRFIRNRSRAITSNVYLNLIPKPSLVRALEADPAFMDVVWEALRALSSRALIDEGRTYGGGLHKLEPKELARARLDLALPVVSGPQGDGAVVQADLF